MELTILTPTFQRAKTLPKLYDSLCRQTCKQFEWLIIDDGSTDETEQIVRKWAANAPFHITYRYKDNGGKQTVINLGAKMIDSPMVFIVDSDDWLTDDAVSTILSYHRKYYKNNVGGFSFLRLFPDGRTNGPKFPFEEWTTTFFQSRVLTNDLSDKAEVWYIHCLREYPFPEYENERYYPEDGIWIRISGKYEMVHVNKGIYVGEYLDGGITDNDIYKRMIKWPKGMVDRAIAYLQNPCRIQMLIKQVVLYVIYGKFGAGYHFGQMYRDCPRKLLFIIFLVPASVLGFVLSLKAKKAI